MAVQGNGHDARVTIRGCARCGGDHPVVVVNKFSVQGHNEYTHWATCPANGEPILIAYEPDDPTPSDVASES